MTDSSETDAEPAPVFQIAARTGKPLTARLDASLQACHDELTRAGEHPPTAVSVALVGDKTMSDLHARFSGDPTPTDVLTFELDSDAEGRCVEGEIVVCVPQARRTCTDRGTSLENEVLLYALHGLLHLIGYDDHAANDFEAMHCREDELLTAIGVGPVFAVGAAGAMA